MKEFTIPIVLFVIFALLLVGFLFTMRAPPLPAALAYDSSCETWEFTKGVIEANICDTSQGGLYKVSELIVDFTDNTTALFGFPYGPLFPRQSVVHVVAYSFPSDSVDIAVDGSWQSTKLWYIKSIEQVN